MRLCSRFRQFHSADLRNSMRLLTGLPLFFINLMPRLSSNIIGVRKLVSGTLLLILSRLPRLISKLYNFGPQHCPILLTIIGISSKWVREATASFARIKTFCPYGLGYVDLFHCIVLTIQFAGRQIWKPYRLILGSRKPCVQLITDFKICSIKIHEIALELSGSILRVISSPLPLVVPVSLNLQYQHTHDFSCSLKCAFKHKRVIKRCLYDDPW